jgi:GNAT superfamily N-acetyltransferase
MVDEILDEVYDKNGEKVIVKWSKGLAFSPAYLLFLKQQAELIENGHGTNFTTWNDSECGVIYTTNDKGRVSGFIVYDHSEIETKKMLSIVLTAVDHDFRNRGLYSIMHKWFEEITKRMGGNRIRATVSPRNIHRLKTCEAMGMKIGFHHLYKSL